MTKANVVLKHVEIRWPYLAKPSTEGEYASGKYQVDVIFNEDQKKLLETLPRSTKQHFKEEDNGLYKVTLKSTVKPRVLDKDCVAMTDEETAKVGNGTIANLRVVSYEARGQFFLGLGDIRIIDLKEYSGNNVQDLLDDDEVGNNIAADTDSDDDDDLA